MRANPAVRMGHSAVFALLVGAAAVSCGGDTQSGPVGASGGASQSGSMTGGAAPSGGGRGGADSGGSLTGGKPAGGVGGSPSGGSTSGGASAGGNSGVGTTGGAPHAGDSGGGTNGGAMAAGGKANGGAPVGGSSAAGAAGAGGCLDVCSRYGGACCGWSGDSCVAAGQSCVFDLLSGGSISSFFYQYADLEAKIAATPETVIGSFADADVDWAAMDSPPTARIQLHLTAQASSRLGSVATRGSWFRVSCGGQSLFVGQFYPWEGAAAIDTPVMDMLPDTDNSLVFYLGAYEGAWQRVIPDQNLDLRQRIDRPELRAVFCQRDALHQLDPNAMPGS
jgi:hypothetical protein